MKQVPTKVGTLEQDQLEKHLEWVGGLSGKYQLFLCPICEGCVWCCNLGIERNV